MKQHLKCYVELIILFVHLINRNHPWLSVRIKGGMSLRNGMWHGLRNDIIMRNLTYADHFQRNKLSRKERPFLAPMQMQPLL